MKKRSLPYSLFPIVYFLSQISFASAGPVQGVYQLTDGLSEIIRILIRFISETIFQIDSFDEFLFAKILLFALILLVVYTVISKNTIFGGRKNNPIQWIISSAISILSIRYLPDNFIQAILLQYNTLGVALTVFLPLIIYFFFIHQSGLGPYGRKVGWLVYIISFFSLWLIREDDLGEANIIYWIAIALVILFIIADKTINKHLKKREIEKAMDESKAERRVHAQYKLRELDDKREFYSEAEYNRAVARWEKVRDDNT